MYSYLSIHTQARAILGVPNFEFKYFWGFSGSSQNWTISRGSFLCIKGSFLKVKVQNGDIFLGLLKFQIFFWGCLKFLIFFGGER